MITYIYKRKLFRAIAIGLALNLLIDSVIPLAALALTSGPSQPEVQSFEPIGTTDMVNLFTGDFNYNIPLFELPGPEGGYPFNLAYHAGIGMDQEASWVGLGWNLNPGAITRQMQGIPDDFNGDVITREVHMKPNVTVGVNAGGNLEFFGNSIGGISLTGLSLYYNNYRGLGYGVNIGAQMSKGIFNAGLDFGMDSQQGASVDLSLTLGREQSFNDKKFRLGLGYNSLDGLKKLSLGYENVKNSYVVKGNNLKEKLSGFKGSASFILTSDFGYTPSSTLPMSGSNVKVLLKGGPGANGFFTNFTIGGFYNRQKIEGSDNGFATFNRQAYGYMNVENMHTFSVRDMNRERDGLVTHNSPNLAVPHATSDMFTATAQGMYGSFKANRSDIGIWNDIYIQSKTKSLTLGGDIPPTLHWGFNSSYGEANDQTQAWEKKNELDDHYQFKSTETGKADYEPYYLRMSGESSIETKNVMDYIGKDAPVRVKLQGVSVPSLSFDDLKDNGLGNAKALAKLENQQGNITDVLTHGNTRSERKKRNYALIPIKNNQLKKHPDSLEVLSLFQVSYDSNGIETPVNRLQATRGNHIGGFHCVGNNGLQYIYGLPVYNNSQVECQFSATPQHDSTTVMNVPTDLANGDYKVSNTEEYYNRTSMPEFTYAHLLTAVIGPDYADIDTIPGPSAGDLGYWVKFNYKKVEHDYQWRAPFFGANYNRGMENRDRDDKGSYMYGTKEIYYLESAETKSHIAKFKTSQREDGRGASEELQNANNFNPAAAAYQYQLDTIKLYTKVAFQLGEHIATPIKSIVFNYDQSLCEGTLNNPTGNGKLTLKRLSFLYGNSTKGSLTPYRFEYDSIPAYHTHKMDRWGSYKPYDNTRVDSASHALRSPYVNQNDSYENLSEYASAWSLNKIHLPSGATIAVDYEADDYAFVQDKTAMQMIPIAGLETPSPSIAPVDLSKNTSNRSVCFKLEQPIHKDSLWLLDRYFDDISDVKFRIRPQYGGDGYPYDFDMVSGYAALEENSYEPDSLIGDYYHYGKFKLKLSEDYHPFAVATWQHIRQNQPEFLGTIDTEANTGKQIIGVIEGLLSFLPDMMSRLRDYYKFAQSKNWGNVIDINNSWVRLNSPDRIKVGGGLRVKQVTLYDNWDQYATDGEGGVYGQVYDYSMEQEIDGHMMKISSGVATNEPYVGSEESALRQLKDRYSQKMRLQRNTVLMEETPINESHYPAAQVGYRKVTVKSLASAVRAGESVNLPSNAIPAGFPIAATGASVYEFYTAYDFPVITKETTIDRKPYKLRVPLGPLGSIQVNNLTASQGYSIELNDMHGRPKKTSHYPQDRDGKVASEAIAYTEHFYKTDQSGKRLDNVVSTISWDAMGNPQKSVNNGLFGHEHEFMVDMRENRSVNWDTGLRVNGDWVLWPFPPIVLHIPSAYPTLTLSTTQMRTAVTNKIIYKSAVLTKVVASDGQSKVSTENLFWDAETGEVALSSVTNNYGLQIYSYGVPAYTKYDGMGPAYKNIGLKFQGTLTALSGQSRLFTTTLSSDIQDLLVPGDEFILSGLDTENASDRIKAIYTGLVEGSPAFRAEGVSLDANYEFFLYRSGRRNLLGAKAETITALADPTKTRNPAALDVTIEIPK